MDEIKQHTIKHQIPKGAVMLTKLEALDEQSSLIAQWKPQSDVWPLMHGRGIMGVTASLIGLYINHRFRRTLKLRSIGLVPSMLSLVTGPALLTSLFHTQVVVNKLLLLEVNCLSCLEIKGAIIQSFFGLVIPVLTTPFVNFAVAGSESRVIPSGLDFRKMFLVTRASYQRMIPQLGLLFLSQVVLGGYMTHLQIKSYLRMLIMLNLFEKEEKAVKMHFLSANEPSTASQHSPDNSI